MTWLLRFIPDEIVLLLHSDRNIVWLGARRRLRWALYELAKSGHEPCVATQFRALLPSSSQNFDCVVPGWHTKDTLLAKKTEGTTHQLVRRCR